MQETNWFSFILALAVLITMGAIFIVLIVKRNIENIDKPFASLAGLFGTILGSMGTFFFTQEQVEEANRQKKESVEATASERRTACDSAVRQVLEENDAKLEFFQEDFQDLYEDFQAREAELEGLKQQMANRVQGP